MESRIGWIDFSPNDRNRVKKFIELMGTGGVVDELGIGMVRDAMSNKLFPGFSTLYTRAKYFFITPYILMERETRPKKMTGEVYFHEAEKSTNNLIKQFYDNHPDRANESYFGKNTDDGALKRQPSGIYWNGILHLHLLETDCSLDQLLADKSSTMDELLSNNRGDDIVKEQGEHKGNGFGNVSYDSHWRDTIASNGLTLTRIESETLCDRIRKYSPDSLPAALVSNKALWDLYQAANKNGLSTHDNAFVRFVESAINLIDNNVLHRNLTEAHDLAIFSHGAHIAYNIKLWTVAGISETQKIDEWRDIGREWFRNLSTKMLDYKGFDISHCMENTNLKQHTKNFLLEMQNLVSNNTDWDKIEDSLCNLAEKQERWNKSAKSRFLKMEKKQVIDEMGKVQWLALPLIPYRYAAALSVVRDIYEGLNKVEE